MHVALVAIASGVMVALSLPPFDLDWLVWFALVPMTVAARGAEGQVQAFLYGAAGMLPAFIGAGYGLFPYHAPLATAFPIVLALLVGGLCVVDAGLHRRALHPALSVLVLPSLWVLGEYVSAAAGIPWALALTQARRPTVVQGAALLGMYSVSFLIVLVNAALAAIVQTRRAGPRLLDAGPPLLAAAVLGGWLASGGWSLACRP